MTPKNNYAVIAKGRRERKEMRRERTRIIGRMARLSIQRLKDAKILQKEP